MNSHLLLITILIAITSAQSIQKSAEEELNLLRRRVDPPCDPRSTATFKSPCTGRHSNSLPRVRWDDALQKVAEAHVAVCPLFYALPEDLPADTHQAQFLLPQASDAASLLSTAFAKWKADGAEYNPKTGYAYNGDTLTYKALVSASATRFACAAKLDCAGGPTGTFSVLQCLLHKGPPAGPSYPALYIDPALSKDFETRILSLINVARKAVARTWRTKKIGAITWSDELAKLAAEHAAVLSADRVYRNDLKQGESVWASSRIHANGAGGALISWFKKGIFYSLTRNQCRYRHKGQNRELSICGEFTQLVHQDVKAVGCAQAWHQGTTFVVCNWDFKAADGRKHISPPLTH